jgi:trigger factor
MQKEVQKLPKSEYELTVTVPAETLAKQRRHILENLAAQVEISGFRKGKAPLEMVESKIGRDRISREILESVLPHSLIEALKEEKLMPITDPAVSILQFELGKDLVYKAKVTVMPEVKLEDYQNIRVKKKEVKEVGEKEIEEAVMSLFERWKVAQETEKGQSKVADSEKVLYTPGGEKISLEKKAPDDEFAKKLGAKDLGDLKDKVKKELEIQEKYQVEKEFENEVVGKALKSIEVEVPEALIEAELNRLLLNFSQYLAQYGLKLQDYLSKEGKTVEQLRAQWRDQAEANVKIELMLRKVSEREGIEVTEAEVSENLPLGDQQGEKTPEEKEREKNYVYHALRQGKALSRLKEIAQK